MEPHDAAMDSSASLTLDAVFDRLRPEMLVDDPRWRPVPSSLPDVVLARLDTGPNSSRLRVQWDVERPFPEVDNAAIVRPEAYFHPIKAEVDPDISSCGIEKVIAPGDAICYLSFTLSPLIRKLSLLAAPHIFAEATVQVPETARVRSVVRRDFPHPGAVSQVVLPLHPQTGAFLEEWGVHKTRAIFLECHASDPEKIRCTGVIEMKPMPDEDMAVAAGALLQSQSVMNKMRDEVNAGSELGAKLLRVMRGDRYIVVAIQGCNRGRPLLPKGPQEESAAASEMQLDAWDPGVHWERASKENWSLAKYLRSFLDFFGLQDLEIYGSLDGRKLMCYQAAVDRCAWERDRVVVAALFGAHRSAYRRLLTCRTGPHLCSDMNPRFVPGDGWHSADSETELASDISQVPVAKTFVHFGKREARRLKFRS